MIVVKIEVDAVKINIIAYADSESELYCTVQFITEQKQTEQNGCKRSPGPGSQVLPT
jgi:hypothetical protein